MKQCMLSTNDNPFNPFDDFDSWLDFDIEKGYYSCSMLDRIIIVQDDFSEIDIANAKELAIDTIIKYDFTDTFKKVTRTYPDLDEEEIDGDTEILIETIQ